MECTLNVTYLPCMFNESKIRAWDHVSGVCFLKLDQ